MLLSHCHRNIYTVLCSIRSTFLLNMFLIVLFTYVLRFQANANHGLMACDFTALIYYNSSTRKWSLISLDLSWQDLLAVASSSCFILSRSKLPCDFQNFNNTQNKYRLIMARSVHCLMSVNTRCSVTCFICE